MVNRMRGIVAALVAVLGSASSSPHVSAQLASPPPDPRGVYLYSLNTVVDKQPVNAPQVVQALNTQGVDGFTLVENWSAIEPKRGLFEWDPGQPGPSHFDLWVQQAVSAGKKINLAIRAGEDTPCWLFDVASQACGPAYAGTYAGARALSFVAASHQGLAVASACEVVQIAAPWDPAFLREWDTMLGSVAAHLRAIGAYGSVALVRETGVNRTTDEFRLPEEVLPSPCLDTNSVAHANTNAISTWLAAGYRPWLLFLAWNSLTASFERNFPGVTFNVPIIPIDTGHGQYPFPEIDARGCVYTSIVPKSEWSTPPAIPANTCTNNADRTTSDSELNAVLFSFLPLSDLNARNHLVVEFENLDTSEAASPTVVQASVELGTMMGFMTNNFLAASGQGAGAACSGGFGSGSTGCTSSADYLSLLNIGIYPCQNVASDTFCGANAALSTYIEVFAPDVVQFPCAILAAHNELLALPPSPVGCQD
jgi:hypothetical protein